MGNIAVAAKGFVYKRNCLPKCVKNLEKVSERKKKKKKKRGSNKRNLM